MVERSVLKLTSYLIFLEIPLPIYLVQMSRTKSPWSKVSSKRTLSRHQRLAATHVWTVMISPENRQQKPYALPVQCIPYKSLTASAARSLINKLVEEMVKRDMKVVGECCILTFIIIHRLACPKFVCRIGNQRRVQYF